MWKLFVFSLFILPLVKGCNVPPMLWCSNETIAKDCEVTDQCKAYNAAVKGRPVNLTLLYESKCPDSERFILQVLYPNMWQNPNVRKTFNLELVPFGNAVVAACQDYKSVSKKQPVKITLLYESKCGGCQNFFLTELYPQIWDLMRNKVEVEMVPYGNARIIDGTIVCQHGSEECQVNMLESCALYYLGGIKILNDISMNFLYCIESLMNKGATGDTAEKKCFQKHPEIDSTTKHKIQSCKTSGMGLHLQMAAANRTSSIKPDKHTWVPWILLNDVSSKKFQDLMQDLPNLVRWVYQE